MNTSYSFTHILASPSHSLPVSLQTPIECSMPQLQICAPILLSHLEVLLEAADPKFSLLSLPLLFLHSLIPLSTSSLLTPSVTSHIQTPKLSTFRFLTSSSKNNISSYPIPVFLCIRAKCVFLSPGKICTFEKKSRARLDWTVTDEDEELDLGEK